MQRSRLLALPLVLAACGDDNSGAPDADAVAAATYYQDVKPIIDAKCTGCHVADGIAPMALTSYDLAKEYGSIADFAIQEGIMPPWPPNPDCNDYVADRSLTDEQKATFSAWVAAGMPEGDPSDPAPPLDVENISLSRVDLELAMPQAYTTTATAAYPDEYRCFVLPFPAEYTTTKYVTGFRAVPGNPKVVHHVIAFYAGPDIVDDYMALDAGEAGDGYTCFGGPGGPSRGEMLGGWAPGGQGSDFPVGTGLEIEPGSAVILQVHYNIDNSDPEPDQSEVWFKIDDTVEKVAQIMQWANPAWLSGSMPIPAGDEDVMHAFQFDASAVTGGDFTIWSAATHQHERGSHNKVEILRDGGGTECLLQIDNWDFHWQGSYGLRNPVTFRQGDQLRIECHWDASEETEDLNWGEGTGEEMCVGFFYVTPN